MSNTPRHCDIAIEYFTLAKELGSYEEANKHFECHTNYSCWYGFGGVNAPSFSPHIHYRRKPETHTVNGHEVPAPYRAEPALGDIYHYIRNPYLDSCEWRGDSADCDHLASNNCFKSESDAEENRLAMFKIGKYAEVNPSYISAKDSAAKALEDVVKNYTRKWSDEFSEVNINLIKKGEGYIYPEALLEFARAIKSGEVDLNSIGKVKV